VGAIAALVVASLLQPLSMIVPAAAANNATAAVAVGKNGAFLYIVNSCTPGQTWGA
jgi:hypothetical protein